MAGSSPARGKTDCAPSHEEFSQCPSATEETKKQGNGQNTTWGRRQGGSFKTKDLSEGVTVDEDPNEAGEEAVQSCDRVGCRLRAQ